MLFFAAILVDVVALTVVREQAGLWRTLAMVLPIETRPKAGLMQAVLPIHALQSALAVTSAVCVQTTDNRHKQHMCMIFSNTFHLSRPRQSL